MENQDRKKIILILRWTAIIVTSYLILFGRGKVTDLELSHLLIGVYILSNILLNQKIDGLVKLAKEQDAPGIKSKLKEIIPEYQPYQP